MKSATSRRHLSLRRRPAAALLPVLSLLFSLSVACLGAPAPKAHPAPESIWTELMAGNRRFVSGKLRTHELRRTRLRLASGQHPKAIILGCSDSRAAPELLFDQSLGDLFVVRTAGSIADPVALGSIEYAVEHLHAPLLIVLGHEHCGAVLAALSGEGMPSKNLQAIVDKIAPAVADFKGKPESKEPRKLSGAFAANVRRSARDVHEGSAIVQHSEKAGHLKLIEALYHPVTGAVTRLD